ncbi:MAG TPA: nitroreductase/quinone reductase family protein [Ktedonosporobacter sp.]|nr:nitroreductase/quinone reductase family protein [Ktedonosporobacter sp.]
MLRRTVLRLHQFLRRGDWHLEYRSADLAWDDSYVRGNRAQSMGLMGPENTSKPMNETHTRVHHPRPPRPVRILVNTIVTAILRSRWHHMRSNRLLLLTFTGRKSGRKFTTPMRYEQEGDTIQMTVVYPWWKNLIEQPAVCILLRGHMRTGTAEVLPEKDEEVVVRVHLKE